MNFGNNPINAQSPAYPYNYPTQPNAYPPGNGYNPQNNGPMPPLAQNFGMVQQPGLAQGLVVPGANGASFDLRKLAGLAQADFKFFIECSTETRGDFAPMVRHCVNTTLRWANHIDADHGTEAYMLDGNPSEPTRVVLGQESAFADAVAANRSMRRADPAGALRAVTQKMLTQASNGQLRPHVLLFAVTGHHLDTDAIISALTHVKDTLKSMGHEHPERVFMVGFLKIGERGGMFDGSKNNLRKLDNHKVVGRMVESDVEVADVMETRIFRMLERFCNPEASGDSKFAGFAQNLFSKAIH